MPQLGLETEIIDRSVYENTVRRFREARIVLPTFAQLARPERIPATIKTALRSVDPDAADPLNLFRVHWLNGPRGEEPLRVADHIELPSLLTGVPARIVVAFADRFPMIHTHKVLAAYGCLAPRLITGQFDPTHHRALWPSTGNYCRGGVAISRIMRCRGVAILPEGMSRERFEWLEKWVAAPEDIIATPGSESNVKEIYDRCRELARDPANIVFNQFCEFGNHLVHYLCTGEALHGIFEALAERAGAQALRLSAFVAASGSAGTLGAGDFLEERHGCRIVAAEALECPTLLYNGFGRHNIQGIGDKHIPLIHNVMNTDVALAVSDRATDCLNILFNTDIGRRYLEDIKRIPRPLVDQLGRLGLSSLCNVIGCIKTAKQFDLGPDDVILTVATDSAEMYRTECESAVSERFGGTFSELDAAEVFGRHLSGIATDHILELGRRERERVFNSGYYTWVEQQGVSLEEFTARRNRRFWTGLRDLIPAWDALIEEFNARTGVADGAS